MDVYGYGRELCAGEEFARVIDEVYSRMDSQLYWLYRNFKQEQLLLGLEKQGLREE